MTSQRPGISRFRLCSFALAVFLLANSVSSVEAAWFTLSWNANPETDIAGYIVFYGTMSGNYTTSVDVGNCTSFNFPEALTGVTYYFAVRAYDTTGRQSAYSEEVTATQISSLSIASFTAARPSPQPSESLITFSASALGGAAPYQYRWVVMSGSASQAVQEWSSVNSFAWKPTLTGSYTINVFARSTGTWSSEPAVVAAQSMPYTIAGSPLAVQELQSSLLSPQGVNTTMTFAAVASGGTGPYQSTNGSWQRTVTGQSSETGLQTTAGTGRLGQRETTPSESGFGAPATAWMRPKIWRQGEHFHFKLRAGS